MALPDVVAQAAVGTGGMLYAFGDNQFGQLGTSVDLGTSSTAVPSPQPVAIALPGAVGGVSRLAAGSDFSLAVTSSGQLYSFGSNQFGELGVASNSGTTTPTPTPTLVSLPGENGTAVAVAAGFAHSLVVTSSGQLYAFGDNEYGQLGTASGMNQPNPTPTVVSLPGENGPVVAVAAGMFDSLAVTATGQLYAFGLNSYGQLGISANAGNGSAPNPTPTLVGVPGDVTAVSAGPDHTLVLTSNGQVYAFGDNEYGELGNTTNTGTAYPNPTPTPVSLPSGAGSPSAVSVGEYHSLVATASGQLYVFGSDYDGQLGIVGDFRTTTNPMPALVQIGGQVSAISAELDSSLVLTTSGQLWAFGSNQDGQLAEIPGTDALEPFLAGERYSLQPQTAFMGLAQAPNAASSLVVASDLRIVTSSLPPGQVGVPYSAALQASGGTPPYSWSWESRPYGTSLDTSTGVLSGTPVQSGSFGGPVMLTDSTGLEVTDLNVPVSIVPGIVTATPTPPPTSTPPTSTPPPTTAVPLSRLAVPRLAVSATSRLSAKRGKVALKIGCRTTACRGLARITETERLRTRRGKRIVTRTKLLVLASGRYALRAGEKGVVELRVSAAGRHLLTGLTHLVHARLEMTVDGGSAIVRRVLLG